MEAEQSTQHVGDLYLACACVDRVAGALQCFEEQYLANVPAMLRTIDPSPAFADEVLQLAREKLFVSDAGGTPKIAAYAGRGPLGGWVSVVAQRIALSLRRGHKAQQRAGERSIAEALPAGGDPELDYLQVRYRALFREAFATAVAALTDRQRLLLRLQVLEQMSHDEIAAIYRVSQSTVTRWTASAREAILHRTQEELRTSIGTDTAEFHSLMAMLGSKLDLSIARLLADSKK
ncbi:MAG TPA: sigma-70 family RNA polymerase sigma factor [Polyangia bacterium]|nr:sigma-70 family RNA polymerase sigma factor [Polyangia bacterium]